MDWWQFGLWGLAGGIISDALEIQRAVKANGGLPPRGFGGSAFWIGEAIRLLGGGGVAIAFGLSALVATPVAALAIGISTPLILDKLRSAPLLLPPALGDPKASSVARPPSSTDTAHSEEQS